MDFLQRVEAYLELHRANRTGEALRRLEAGLGHAESLFIKNVWIPAAGNLDGLYPQFEIVDFKGGDRYIDYAYRPEDGRVALEIDGYNSHARQISRWQFSDHIDRQNHLVLDGWKVLRFSYDQIRDHPRPYQQIIQQMMGQLLHREALFAPLSIKEREVVRLAARLNRPITLADVQTWLNIHRETARLVLKALARKEWIQPASGRQRVTSYMLTTDRRLLQ